jgi:hypothetical protein
MKEVKRGGILPKNTLSLKVRIHHLLQGRDCMIKRFLDRYFQKLYVLIANIGRVVEIEIVLATKIRKGFK